MSVGVFAGGCSNFGGKVAAVVNGQVITQTEVDQRMARLSPSYRQALAGDSRRLLEEMIMETILLQEARRRGLDRDAEVDKLVREAKRQILLGRLLETVRDGKTGQVTELEIAKNYEQNKSLYMEPETFRASHILVQTEQEAKKVFERLKSGEDFSKVAQEVSIDSTKAKGGDIGYFSKGQLIPEFETACESLQPGQTSGIVKTQIGYHVIKLTEKKAARQLALDEVRERIRKQLSTQQQQQQVETFIQQLRAKAQVQIKNGNLASKAVPAAPISNKPAAESAAPQR